MNQEEIEKINKNNGEISEALKELNLNKQSEKQQPVADPSDISKKAEEAFKEFQLQHSHNQPESVTKQDAPKQKIETVTQVIPGIEEALKKFEEKSIIEQQQKKPLENKREPQTPKMVRLVIKYSGGLIKEERSAEYVLLGFAILFFSVSLYLFFRGNITSKNVQQPPAGVLEQMKQMQTNQKNNS